MPIYMRLFVSALLSSAKILFAHANLAGNRPIIRGLGCGKETLLPSAAPTGFRARRAA